MKPEHLRGHVDGLALGVLALGPAHGYAVIQRLRACSDGELDLPEGTVYPALHRLEAAGFVAAEMHEVQGRRRKVYSLTAAGRAELVSQQAQWQRFSVLVTRVLGVPA
jgi:DNA-binding PadR family transcriptional regulator